MTLQEERDALQKRMDEIDAEIAGFPPGWYVCIDNSIEINKSEQLRNIKKLEEYKQVMGPDQSLEQRPGITQ